MSSSQITSRTPGVLPSSAVRWWAIAPSMNSADARRSLQDVFDLRRRQPGVDRHHHRADPRDGVHQLEIAVAVERQDRHPVAALHAQRRQCAGHAGHAVGRLLPGPPAGGEGGRRPARPDLQGAPQPLSQGKHGSVKHVRSGPLVRAARGIMVREAMNEMTPPSSTGSAGLRSAGSGLHRRSLPVLPAAAAGGAGLQGIAGLLAADPLRGRGLLAARPPLRQGLRRQHHPPLRRRPDERAGDRQSGAHDAGGRSARSHAAARPGDQGLHRPPRRRHAAAHPQSWSTSSSTAWSTRAAWT